jgi:hypothetical protein
MALHPLWTLAVFSSFLIHLGWGISPSQGHYLYAEQYKQNKRTDTSTPRVRLEPTILVFEWAQTVHTLDGAAVVIGINN